MAAELNGTVALVSGASSGIGAAAALALAEHGAAVALAARRADRLAALVERIEAAGGTALALSADVTDRDQVEAAVAAAVERFGRLDTVLNNAGVMLLGDIEAAPVAEWDQMIDVNLRGLLYAANAALPHLLKAAQSPPRRVADLVNVSSVAGRVASRGSGVYNLTKHGVGAFSESLRQEMVERHVRVSLIEPGIVDTELTDHIRDGVREETKTRFARIEPLQATDIASEVVHIVTRPRHVAISELLIRPAEQLL